MNPLYQARIGLLGIFNDRVSQAPLFADSSKYHFHQCPGSMYMCPELHEKSLFFEASSFYPFHLCEGVNDRELSSS